MQCAGRVRRRQPSLPHLRAARAPCSGLLLLRAPALCVVPSACLGPACNVQGALACLAPRVFTPSNTTGAWLHALVPGIGAPEASSSVE